MSALLDALRSRRVIVLCGTGGVGKTTVSAALAVRLAHEGRRVIVLTIDPARRLADALGIDGRANTLVDVPLPTDVAGAGRLSAMMLDARATFDEVVSRFAPDPVTRQKILDNPYYQRAAGALSGSHEYMAMEKLLELCRDHRFDVVVLDTPPTRNALDFLLAPARLLAVLDGGALKWLQQTSGFSATQAGLRLFGRGREALFSVFERLTGAEVVRGIAEFVSAFSALLDGFGRRAAEARTLLEGTDAAFILVAAPNRGALSEALIFREQLRGQGLPFLGFVVNRMPPEEGQLAEIPRTPEALGLRGPGDDPAWTACAEAALLCWRARVREASMARQHVANLRERCGDSVIYHLIPEAEAPPSSVSELLQVPL